jgi:hypothetical protein
MAPFANKVGVDSDERLENLFKRALTDLVRAGNKSAVMQG